MTGPVLRIGTRGEAVRRLQEALCAVGWRLTPDGIFGLSTAIAVEQFQELHGLAPDGVVGPKTSAALAVRANYPNLRQLAGHDCVYYGTTSIRRRSS